MLKTFKWIYKLGYNRARDDVFKLLESERGFHADQAHIKSLQEKQDSKYDLYKDRVVTPEHHEQRRIEVDNILNRLDPETYPNLDNFMDMLK